LFQLSLIVSCKALKLSSPPPLIFSFASVAARGSKNFSLYDFFAIVRCAFPAVALLLLGGAVELVLEVVEKPNPVLDALPLVGKRLCLTGFSGAAEAVGAGALVSNDGKVVDIPNDGKVDADVATGAAIVEPNATGGFTLGAARELGAPVVADGAAKDVPPNKLAVPFDAVFPNPANPPNVAVLFVPNMVRYILKTFFFDYSNKSHSLLLHSQNTNISLYLQSTCSCIFIIINHSNKQLLCNLCPLTTKCSQKYFFKNS
jgi:hypothetical protein